MKKIESYISESISAFPEVPLNITLFRNSVQEKERHPDICFNLTSPQWS